MNKILIPKIYDKEYNTDKACLRHLTTYYVKFANFSVESKVVKVSSYIETV